MDIGDNDVNYRLFLRLVFSIVTYGLQKYLAGKSGGSDILPQCRL